MHWTQLPHGPEDQIFTHIDSSTRKETVYAVTLLRRYCESAGHPISEIPIDGPAAKMILRNRGLEKPRFRRAVMASTYQPLLFCFQPDGTHLLVDGSHSYVAMFTKNRRTALAYLVDEPIWRHFLVEGLPTSTSEEELLNSFSGDPATREEASKGNFLLRPARKA